MKNLRIAVPLFSPREMGDFDSALKFALQLGYEAAYNGGGHDDCDAVILLTSYLGAGSLYSEHNHPGWLGMIGLADRMRNSIGNILNDMGIPRDRQVTVLTGMIRPTGVRGVSAVNDLNEIPLPVLWHNGVSHSEGFASTQPSPNDAIYGGPRHVEGRNEEADKAYWERARNDSGCEVYQNSGFLLCARGAKNVPPITDRVILIPSIQSEAEVGIYPQKPSKVVVAELTSEGKTMVRHTMNGDWETQTLGRPSQFLVFDHKFEPQPV